MRKLLLWILCIGLLALGGCGGRTEEEITAEPVPEETPVPTRDPGEAEPLYLQWYQDNASPSLPDIAAANAYGEDRIKEAAALAIDAPYIRDISFLKDCTSLTCLILYCDALTDLSPLAELPLSLLNLSISGEADLSPLAELPLVNLEIASDSLRELSPLAGLRELKSLSLQGGSITDISVLSGFPGLRTLELHCPEIDSLAPLSGMTELTTLSVYSAHDLDISPLLGLPLTELALICQSFDPAALAGMNGLKKLTLETSDTAALEIAGALPLEDLTLSLSQGPDSLYFLKNGGTVTRLSLTLPGSFRDVSALAAYIRLESLYINIGDGSVDLSPLSGFTSLTALSVIGAEIVSAESLASCKALVFAYLMSDNLSVEQIESLRDALPGATVEADSYSWAG
ncbi:MAG: hypothetical protein ACOX17_09725 [Christensenellales bacterium]